jgi:AraC-like DNA-binding protein
MSEVSEDKFLPVRKRWLAELNRQSQELTRRFVPGEDLPDSEEILAFVRTLPHASNAAETSLLKAVLLDLAFRWSVFAHARFHGGRRCSCLFTTLEPLAESWRVDPQWNGAIAREWAAACAGIGDRLRARQDARRLASLLVERHQDFRPVSTYAERLGAEPWRLARTFLDEFGCTPHAFLTRIRIARAIAKLAEGEKTEGVAGDVGYRSKKDLFGALKKLTGLRPSKVRKLPRLEILSIIERLEPRHIRATPE